MTRKVVVVGSTSFPIDSSIGTQVVEELQALGADLAILTRGSEGFDQFIGHVCIILGVPCFTYRSAGGADNFLRDVELVRDADEVIAFFDPATLDRTDTGTGHIVEVALTQQKPVRAYTSVDGSLVWVGETP